MTGDAEGEVAQYKGEKIAIERLIEHRDCLSWAEWRQRCRPPTDASIPWSRCRRGGRDGTIDDCHCSDADCGAGDRRDLDGTGSQNDLIIVRIGPIWLNCLGIGRSVCPKHKIGEAEKDRDALV